MIHLNQLVKEQGLVGYLLGITYPETYQATSIRELMEERKEIKPTNKLLFPAVCFLTATLVTLPWVYYTKLDSFKAKLEDMNDSVNVLTSSAFGLWGIDESIIFEDSTKRLGKETKKKIYKPTLVYQPKTDLLWLHRFNSHGPQSPEKNQESSYNLNLELVRIFA